MRILRGLSSRILTCGCMAGVYETYDGDVIAVIDAPEPGCGNDSHAAGKVVSIEPDALQPASARNTSSDRR